MPFCISKTNTSIPYSATAEIINFTAPLHHWDLHYCFFINICTKTAPWVCYRGDFYTSFEIMIFKNKIKPCSYTLLMCNIMIWDHSSLSFSLCWDCNYHDYYCLWSLSLWLHPNMPRKCTVLIYIFRLRSQVRLLCHSSMLRIIVIIETHFINIVLSR